MNAVWNTIVWCLIKAALSIVFLSLAVWLWGKTDPLITGGMLFMGGLLMLDVHADYRRGRYGEPNSYHLTVSTTKEETK